MALLKSFWLKLKALLRKNATEREIEEELRGHIELRIEENIEAGMTPEEARQNALRRFGNLTHIREVCREMRGARWVETLLQDARYGLRMMERNPGFTALAVLSLALGIGANTAIFSLLDAVLLKMLPVREPEQLVQLLSDRLMTVTNKGGGFNAFSYPAFLELRKQNSAITGLFASANTTLDMRHGSGEAETVRAQYVSGEYFVTLGVRPVLGRTITPADDSPSGVSPVTVISHGFWKRRLGLDSAVLGKNLTLGTGVFTIIGVAPPGFFGVQLGSAPEVWVPLAMEPRLRSPSWTSSSGYKWLQLMARLDPRVPLEQAQAALQPVFHETVARDALLLDERDRPKFLQQIIRVERAANGLSRLRRQFSEPLQVLMAVSGLVLLIACANVASLLVARATARRREVAVRLALGAGALRLIRQLLTESVLLALLGGGAGLLLAQWAANALVRFMANGGPLLLDIKPDGRMLGFTLVVSIITGIVFGLVPAYRAVRLLPGIALREGTRGVIGSGGSRALTGRLLVVAQVALALFVLVGGGLFVRSLRNLQSLDTGFHRDSVYLFSLDPEKAGYTGTRAKVFSQELLQRLETIPGIRSAALCWTAPITGGGGIMDNVSVEGYTPRADESMSVHFNFTSPGFFETLDTPVLQGREFGPQDAADSQKTVVINQTMAKYFFGNTRVIGKKVTFGDGTVREIVGVVADTKYETLTEQIPRTLFLPFMQGSPGGMTVMVRSTGAARDILSTVTREVRAIAGKLPLIDFRSLDEHVNRSLLQQRLITLLSSLFAALAVLLSCVGLYGLMSYTVAQRTSEIGIRVALGSTRLEVLWLVLREALALVIAGAAVGIPAALTGTRVVSAMLFGLTPTDPGTFAAASLLFLVIAILAASFPALRAARVDPITALRCE